MTQSDLLEQRIRDRAYAIWQEEGEPSGRAEEHWAKARAELMPAKPSKAAGAKKPKAPAEPKSAPKKAATGKATAKKPAAKPPAAKSKAEPKTRARKSAPSDP